MTWLPLSDRRKPPQNAIAPVKIEMEGLFNLDVDDDIWLDIGLGYDDEDDHGGGIGSAPLLWLSDDNVQAGIWAMLDRDCCLEERKRLLNERDAMQEWFSEEWMVVLRAMQDGKYCFLYSYMQLIYFFTGLGRGVQYQLNLWKEQLCRLFVTWERSIVGVPCGEIYLSGGLQIVKL